MIVYHGSTDTVPEPDVRHSCRCLDFLPGRLVGASTISEQLSGVAMTDGQALERLYRELLEEELILHLAQVKGMSLEEAMRRYYSSKLADNIGRGAYGVQYLDHKVLVDILIETEPEVLA